MRRGIGYRHIICYCISIFILNGCCVKAREDAAHPQTFSPRFLLTSYSINNIDDDSTKKQIRLCLENVSEDDILISGTPDGNTWCDYDVMLRDTHWDSSLDSPLFGMITMHEVGLRPHPWTLMSTRKNVQIEQQATLLFKFDTDLDYIAWNQIEELSVKVHCIPFAALSHFPTIRAFEASTLFRESYYTIKIIKDGKWCGKENVYEGKR